MTPGGWAGQRATEHQAQATHFMGQADVSGRKEVRLRAPHPPVPAVRAGPSDLPTPSGPSSRPRAARPGAHTDRSGTQQWLRHPHRVPGDLGEQEAQQGRWGRGPELPSLLLGKHQLCMGC